MTPKKRTRTIRREAARDAAKLSEAREKLALLEPGGVADRPIEVTSASQIEPHARSMHCPTCGDGYRVVEHEALPHDGKILRVVRVLSPHCGKRRTLYFAIGTALPS